MEEKVDLQAMVEKDKAVRADGFAAELKIIQDKYRVELVPVIQIAGNQISSSIHIIAGN